MVNPVNMQKGSQKGVMDKHSICPHVSVCEFYWLKKYFLNSVVVREVLVFWRIVLMHRNILA